MIIKEAQLGMKRSLRYKLIAQQRYLYRQLTLPFKKNPQVVLMRWFSINATRAFVKTLIFFFSLLCFYSNFVYKELFFLVFREQSFRGKINSP